MLVSTVFFTFRILWKSNTIYGIYSVRDAGGTLGRAVSRTCTRQVLCLDGMNVMSPGFLSLLQVAAGVAVWLRQQGGRGLLCSWTQGTSASLPLW